jgi:hypothetical protein
MIHETKALGLALVALAALGALAASAAQAARLDVPGRENAVIRGERDTGSTAATFTFPENGGQFACQVSNLEGTIQRAPEIKELREGTLTATYSGCTFSSFPVTFDMNGCKYTITGESNAVDPAETAWFDITACTTGKHIEITIPSIGCTITLLEQNTLSHLVTTNVAGAVPKHLRVDATVSGITWEQDGVFCPRGNAAHGQNATFTAETTVKAFEDAAPGQQITENGHQFQTLGEGAQVDLIAT